MTIPLFALSVLAASLAGVTALPGPFNIGNNAGWTPKFKATAWNSGGRGPLDSGVQVYYTGQPGCSGIQQLTGIPRGGGNYNWLTTYCLSNDGRFGDKGNWNIRTDLGFAVSSATSDGDLADQRLVYWHYDGRREPSPAFVLRDAYWNPRAGPKWKPGKLNLSVMGAEPNSLALTSWSTGGIVGMTVFYVQDGWLKEMTMIGDGEWSNQGREGVQLHFDAGEISAASWVERGNVVQKRVYVRNTETLEVVEFVWSSATPYTAAQNLFLTPGIVRGAAADAASVQNNFRDEDLYMWTVGPLGGNVEVNDRTHGHRAKRGTKLAAASQPSGTSFGFWIDADGHLKFSSRDNAGHWNEDDVISVGGSP